MVKVDICSLKQYPVGPLSSEHFDFTSVEKEFDVTNLPKGSIVAELLNISVDPYMRTRFVPGMGYLMPGFEIGKPIASGCVARVTKSNNDDYPEGSLVTGFMPWETIQLVEDPSSLTRLPTMEGIPTSYFLGVLGMTGISAYLPFKHFAKDYLLSKENPVIFVSGSAGAVGSVFGQLCKALIPGCTVLGAAGSQEKIDFCTKKLKFDKAFNYKNGIAQGLDGVLKGNDDESTTKTIDLYFDNVGGEMLDECLLRMSHQGKIICCGSISTYDKAEVDKYALKNYFQITAKSLQVTGFLALQWGVEEMTLASKELAALLGSGDIIAEETILNGFDKVVEGLTGLFRGDNIGKMVISLE